MPALGVLLSDEELSHIARGALEVISGEEAGAALRAALPQLRGDQRLGVISSLGRRADVQAVTLLVTLLDDTDPQVVAASVAALGHIPAPEAVSAVLGCVSRADPDTRSAAADAAFRVAQRDAARRQIAGGGRHLSTVRIRRRRTSTVCRTSGLVGS